MNRFLPYLVLFYLGAGCTFNTKKSAPEAGEQSAEQFSEKKAPAAVDVSKNEMYFESYIQANVSSCELRNLERHWGLGLYETKLAIGERFTNSKDLLGEIQAAAKKATAAGLKICDFWELDFQYEDAEAMAKFWGTDTYEAKMSIAEKVAATSQLSFKKQFRKQLNRASSLDPIEAFYRKYDDCHAKMIAHSYGMQVSDTKIWLGELLQNDPELVDYKLKFAQDTVKKDPAGACHFGETSYTYADAQKLSKIWKVSVFEAKSAVVQKYTWGMEQNIDALLQ